MLNHHKIILFFSHIKLKWFKSREPIKRFPVYLTIDLFWLENLIILSSFVHNNSYRYAAICYRFLQATNFFNGLANKIILRNSSDPDLYSDFWPDPDSMNMDLKHCESVCVCGGVWYPPCSRRVPPTATGPRRRPSWPPARWSADTWRRSWASRTACPTSIVLQQGRNKCLNVVLPKMNNVTPSELTHADTSHRSRYQEICLGGWFV